MCMHWIVVSRCNQTQHMSPIELLKLTLLKGPLSFERFSNTTEPRHKMEDWFVNPRDREGREWTQHPPPSTRLGKPVFNLHPCKILVFLYIQKVHAIVPRYKTMKSSTRHLTGFPCLFTPKRSPVVREALCYPDEQSKTQLQRWLTRYLTVN